MARRRQQVIAAAEALFATDAGPPPRDRLERVAADALRFAVEAGPRVRFAFHAALWVLTWVVPLLLLRLPPFGRLPLDRRVRAWNRAEGGPLGPLFVVVKMILCLHWYEQPEAFDELGYEPAWRLG